MTESLFSDKAFIEDAEVVDTIPQEKMDAAVTEVESVDVVQPIGVLNHSIKEDGTWCRVVVVDLNGKPKPNDSISVTKDTSIQIFDPQEGDVLVESNEGVDEYVIRSIKDEEGGIDDVVGLEYLQVVKVFLSGSDDHQRYFSIAGETDTIDGKDLNEVYRRRKHLSDLLEGLAPPIDDQLANWIERSAVINTTDLSWKKSKKLGKTIDLSISYKITNGETSLDSCLAVVWRLIGGKPVGELLQININPATLITGTKNGTVYITQEVELDEHVFKVLICEQTNDTPYSISLYTETGVPEDAIPWLHLNDQTKHHAELIDFFKLEEFTKDRTVMMNDPFFKCDWEFDFNLIEERTGGTYQESRFIDEDGEMLTVDLRSRKSRKTLPEKSFEMHICHLFKAEAGIDSVCFVNVPDEILQDKEEDNGTIEK